MDRQDEYLFVYGTLRSDVGGREHQMLIDHAERVGLARVPGCLYDLGPYPCMTEGSDTVVGEVYRVLRPGLLDRLDEYEDCREGGLYTRRKTTATLDNGKALRVWVYLYVRPLPDNATRLAHGDYAGRTT